VVGVGVSFYWREGMLCGVFGDGGLGVGCRCLGRVWLLVLLFDFCVGF